MNKDDFENWLKKYDHKTQNSAYNYKMAIPHISEHYSNFKGETIDLYNTEFETLKNAVEIYGLRGNFSEYGKKGNGTYRNALNALLRMNNSQRPITTLINEVTQKPWFQELINENKFYFQYLLDVKDKFFNYQIPNSTIEEIKEDYSNYDDGSFENFVLQSKDKVKPFLELLAEYISYLDIKASGKNRWNKYDDKRAIALAFVRMPFWVNALLSLKININEKLKRSVKNAIRYSMSPMENLTVLSENHREALSKVLLDKSYNKKTFQQDLIDYFQQFDIKPKNRMNYTYIISSILYAPEIKDIWNPKQEEEEMTQDIYILFEDYLRKKDFSQNSINTYVNSINTRIPRIWNKIYKSNYDAQDFSEDTVHKLIDITRRTYQGDFKGKQNFRDFLKTLLNGVQEEELKLPLNQILYGPPGTGKTYSTKEIAVNIILGESERTREEILMNYEELQKSKHIVFTTFHQSMSYEDFVEGIKPIMSGEEEDIVKYEVKSGIFKQLCSRAKGVSGSKEKVSSIDFSNRNYFKMSLGGKNRPETHNWCIKNNKIGLGWGDNKDYSSYMKISDWYQFRDKFKNEFPQLVEASKFHIQAVYTFQNMKKGDIVIISKGNHILDAIGIIEGDYEYDSNNHFGLFHLRDVKWLAKDMNATPELFLDVGISQQAVYGFKKQDVKIESFIEYFHEPKSKNLDKYVLIIDEINRGNVSAIFGELITLLEDDKRKGSKEEVEVILPYSKEMFSVPKNLHIIGTMNTADRSVEALDTALRRRFSFNEILPKPNVLKEIHKTNGIIEGGQEYISLIKLLEAINHRIELLIDKDHTIGHSYFINVLDFEGLIQVFKDKVIPLLEEYFYGDFAKIGLVLGKAFVKPVQNENKATLADFEHDDKITYQEKKVFCFTDSDSWEPKSFHSIYKKDVELSGK